MQFPTPLLVCDIGGTNVRMARLESVNAALSAPVFLQTNGYDNLDTAILATGALGKGIRSVVACGAGPAIGRELKLTNASWRMKGEDIARKLGLGQGLLLNDFEALALSLPVITDSDCHVIIDGNRAPTGPQLILGPGTGLGIGALIVDNGRYIPLPSEACHIELGPLGDEQEALWPLLTREFGRVSTEAVMSGRGLINLHRARMRLHGMDVSTNDPSLLTAQAISDCTNQAAASVRLFWQIMARFAGDMAITFMASGGVTLAGGILPRLVPCLDTHAFAQAFTFKGPASNFAKTIAVRLITAPDRVLGGMAAIAIAPQLYGIDYAARTWVVAET